MRARTLLGHLIAGIGILLVSVPAGMVVAFLLFPFWRWLEESTGIESVGHSGPAEWCFDVSIAVCALALVSLYVAIRKHAAPRLPNE